MALKDRIARIFRRGEPADEPTTIDASPMMRQTYATLAERMQAETRRRDVVTKCREMYRTDARIKRIIRTTARDSIKGWFTVTVPDDKEAEDVAYELIKRLKLKSRLDDWLRLAFRDGDLFLELGITTEKEIVDVTRKPALEMHRNSNNRDRFDNAQRAYWWHPEPYLFHVEPPDNAVWFAQWQIIHARWEHEESERYGAPMFGAAIGAWKKAVEGELDTAVRRKTRSGIKYLHVLEGASQADIEAYQERNKASFSNPFAAVADFFATKSANLQVVQGDTNLAEIGDVLHHISTMWTASPLPMGLVGYGERLNRDVLESQQDQYQAEMEVIVGWITDEILAPLFERQWLLAGYYPPSMDYTIEWASKKTITPAMLYDAARAIGVLASTGRVTDESLLRILARFLPGFDWQKEWEAVEQMLAAQQALIPGQVARIGQVLRKATTAPRSQGEEEPTSGGDGRGEIPDDLTMSNQRSGRKV